jgi:nitrogen fixation/metabolism regulation signal transduction histidine kinase
MVNLQQVRGSGVRLTLPYVLRVSGMWLLVSALILLVFSVTCYTALFLRIPAESRGPFVVLLVVQTVFVLLALVALAVFSTHRIAGPLIALRRACEEVKAGNFDRPLRFRRSDPHLGELADSFNEMVAAIRQRLAAGSESSQ